MTTKFIGIEKQIKTIIDDCVYNVEAGVGPLVYAKRYTVQLIGGRALSIPAEIVMYVLDELGDEWAVFARLTRVTRDKKGSDGVAFSINAELRREDIKWIVREA